MSPRSPMPSVTGVLDDAISPPQGRPVRAARLNRRHWLVFGVCAAGFFFDSMDLQLMSLVAPVLMREWSLGPHEIGLLTSAAMVGMLCGSLVFGVVADRIGRRPTFQLTVLMFAVATALCAAAVNPAQLVLLRFLTGIGIGGFIPVDTALLSEFMPASWRGRMVAAWGIAFPVGGLLATWVVSALLPHLGWRGVFLAGFVPALLVFAMRARVPETPRYLETKGDHDGAAASRRWIGLGADPPPEPPVAPARSRGRVRDLFDPGLRRSTGVVWPLWFLWSFGYFGLTLWLPTLLVLGGMPLDSVLRYTIGFQLAAIAGRLVLLLLVDRVGRKPLIVASGAAAAALVAAFGVQQGWVWLVVCGYLLAFFQDGGFSGIVPYTPELYPTRLRSTGVGWANGAGRAAALLAPLLVGSLVAAHLTGAVFAVCAACYALAAAVVGIAGREPTTEEVA